MRCLVAEAAYVLHGLPACIACTRVGVNTPEMLSSAFSGTRFNEDRGASAAVVRLRVLATARTDGACMVHSLVVSADLRGPITTP